MGVAGAGLMLGHRLAYLLDAPQALARDEILRATGHAYLPYVTQVALLAGVIGLAALFLARLSRRERAEPFGREWARLAVVQSTAFVVMEVGERLASGATLADLAHGRLLPIGLGAQIALALIGAVVLRSTQRAADAVAQVVRASAPAASALTRAPALAAVATPPRSAMLPAGSRAPPPSP
jgi:hypothetical protein